MKPVSAVVQLVNNRLSTANVLASIVTVITIKIMNRLAVSVTNFTVKDS
jgi:hypothetical protein